MENINYPFLKLKPLQEFYCDTCGEKINSVDEGYVIWDSSSSQLHENFRIVHQKLKSPLQRGCYTEHSSSMSLDNFFGKHKNLYILNLLDITPLMMPERSSFVVGDIRNFTEFLRRITLPYYEEARTYFSKYEVNDLINDSNDVFIFSEDRLLEFIETVVTNND